MPSQLPWPPPSPAGRLYPRQRRRGRSGLQRPWSYKATGLPVNGSMSGRGSFFSNCKTPMPTHTAVTPILTHSGVTAVTLTTLAPVTPTPMLTHSGVTAVTLTPILTHTAVTLTPVTPTPILTHSGVTAVTLTPILTHTAVTLTPVTPTPILTHSGVTAVTLTQILTHTAVTLNPILTVRVGGIGPSKALSGARPKACNDQNQVFGSQECSFRPPHDPYLSETAISCRFWKDITYPSLPMGAP